MTFHPSRGSSAVEQQTHNLPVAGSIPAPASQQRTCRRYHHSARAGVRLLGRPAPKCAAGTRSMSARPIPVMVARISPSGRAGALTSLSAARRFLPGHPARLFSSSRWQAGTSLPSYAPRVLLKPAWAPRAFVPGASVAVGVRGVSMPAV